MIRNRPTITDPEAQYRVFKNVSGTTLVRGASVYFLGPNEALAGTSPNSVFVSLPATSARLTSLWAGVCHPDEGIPDGEWGRFQVSGYCDYARVAADTVSTTAIGDFLTGVLNQNHLTRTTTFSRVVCLETIAADALATVAVRKVMLFGGV